MSLLEHVRDRLRQASLVLSMLQIHPAVSRHCWATHRLVQDYTHHVCVQTSYTPTAMNYDFALITLSEQAPASCGYFGLYQPASTGSVTVNITTAGDIQICSC